MITYERKKNYIVRLKERDVDICNGLEETIYFFIKDEMGLSRKDILGKSRHRDLVVARKVIVTILNNYYDIHEDISGLFINRDRTTALYYMRNFKSDYKYDRLFRTAYDKILFRTNFIERKNITPNEYKKGLEEENKHQQETIERYRAKIEELESIIQQTEGVNELSLS
tara:strand:- start:1970 stop:2476 length:507 start_codon:yes stop_codon:yes gene_type:complete